MDANGEAILKLHQDRVRLKGGLAGRHEEQARAEPRAARFNEILNLLSNTGVVIDELLQLVEDDQRTRKPARPGRLQREQFPNPGKQVFLADVTRKLILLGQEEAGVLLVRGKSGDRFDQRLTD